MIPRRLTAARKLVSLFDPAWYQLLNRKGSHSDYSSTYDINKLGDIKGLDEPFTVFEALPLKTSHECYVDSENWWEIFRTHVRSVDGMKIEFEKDGDRIKNEYKEEIGFVYVRDIAQQIINLANGDGLTVFFSPPDGVQAFMRSCLLRRASVEAASQEASVRSAAAKLKL